ncbi:M1 family metallopeptidase [Actinocatenispora comari]|uniref:Aminopeptidase N n=1 Tax=Actinocatenispora comari TaxID=2807577 RepID=A0A8J4ABH4_9ACTN|nr:M1 family metallopeptidase [Actinocatenispora comari]GIL27630.1 peptidase [Actinocatenispora comari]
MSGKRIGRALTALGAAALATVLAVGVAPAASASGGVGAPGIGDPYYPDYGNGGYRISHYDLDLDYQPGNDHLAGTATLTGVATQYLTRFDLDFALTTDAVTVNGRPARFDRSGDHELVLTPTRALHTGQRMVVQVRYHGIPSTVVAEGFTSWMRTDDGAVAANEPEISWWWYPSNDHPLDKASYAIDVTVPTGYQAISNGILAGRHPAGHGTTTWRWRESRPMATYLAVLAVGHYDLDTSTDAHGRPVIEAYDQGLSAAHAKNARASVGLTASVIDWESSVFGPYPFDALGGIVPNHEAGFALEDQTRPMYGLDFFESAADPYVVVHENAHQWFGDSVSVHHWSDIWLNEGFAGYTEWLWSEHTGAGSALSVALADYDSHPADDPLWSVKVGDPGAKHQFSDAVYDRGAMTLQALRNVVGDRTFFTILRTWASTHRYGNGSIPQFEWLAERLSGRDLSQLFDTWLFTTGKPPRSAFHLPAGTAVPAAAPASLPQLRRTHALLAGH